MSRNAVAAAVLVWLGFTGSAVGRAEPAQETGGAVRLGSAVGFTQLGAQTVNTLGGEVGIGYRIGALTLEVDYDQLAMLEYLPDHTGNRSRGDLSRFGVAARLPFLRLGGGADPDSLFRLYVEAGAGRQLGRWDGGGRFARNDLSAGAGFVLDHHRRRAGGLPFRWIGWQLGWRFSEARADSVEPGADVSARLTCRATDPSAGCGPPMPGPGADLALVVTSSISASW